MMHSSDMKWLAAASIGLAVMCALKPGIARAEQHIVCPPEVDWRQISVASPVGWKGLYRPKSKIKLYAARVWIGPLNEVPGELIGETVKGKNGATINKFPLTPAPVVDGVPMELDKWLVCTYGDEGIVQAMKLPKDTKECAVTYRRVQDPLEPRRKFIDVLSDITCK